MISSINIKKHACNNKVMNLNLFPFTEKNVKKKWKEKESSFSLRYIDKHFCMSMRIFLDYSKIFHRLNFSFLHFARARVERVFVPFFREMGCGWMGNFMRDDVEMGF